MLRKRAFRPCRYLYIKDECTWQCFLSLIIGMGLTKYYMNMSSALLHVYFFSRNRSLSVCLKALLFHILTMLTTKWYNCREKEYSESSGSSPTHHTDPKEVTSEGGNLNETALESNLNGNLIMGSTASTANDNEHILGTTTAAFGNQPTVAVGQRIEVARYASQEWRGNTAKAHTIKQVRQGG